MMECDLDEYQCMIGICELQRSYCLDCIDSAAQDFLSIDPNDALYQNCRFGTKLALDVGTVLVGGAGLAKAGYKGLGFGSQSCKALAKATALPKTIINPISPIEQVAKAGSRKRFVPSPNAEGAHTVFRRNGTTGQITHYETYIPQTNPRNPNQWESVKRFDGIGTAEESHFNKVLKERIYTPHVHDPHTPGGIRYAEQWEIPKGLYNER